MGFFDNLKRAFSQERTPHIPREIFMQDVDDDENEQEDEGEDASNKTTATTETPNEPNTIQKPMENNPTPLQGKEEIEDFFNKDFGPEGYKDSLINPDSSNMESNKQIKKLQLEIIIERALKYYNDKLKEFDFHIKTRTQSGLLDTVEEVEAEKKKILEEIENINTILTEARENRGKGQIVVLTYERGFKRGLAAITAAKLFGKQPDNE